MNFINSLDPNLVATLVSALFAGGAWLYHKARGEKTDSARDVLDSVVTQVINSPGVDLDNIKTKAESKIREALAKRKVTGALAEALVHEFVEYAAAQLHERFDTDARNLKKISDEAQAAADAFKNAKPLVPVDMTGGAA